MCDKKKYDAKRERGIETFTGVITFLVVRQQCRKMYFSSFWLMLTFPPLTTYFPIVSNLFRQYLRVERRRSENISLKSTQTEKKNLFFISLKIFQSKNFQSVIFSSISLFIQKAKTEIRNHSSALPVAPHLNNQICSLWVFFLLFNQLLHHVTAVWSERSEGNGEVNG